MAGASEMEAEIIAPLPRISVQAFCETQEVAQVMQAAFADRRMERTHAKHLMGGAPAAVEAFRHAPTPNVIMLESTAQRAELIAALDTLSDFCDAGTKVIVVGRRERHHPLPRADVARHQRLPGLPRSAVLEYRPRRCRISTHRGSGRSRGSR